VAHGNILEFSRNEGTPFYNNTTKLKPYAIRQEAKRSRTGGIEQSKEPSHPSEV
jgi:hypothetical protein